MAIQYKLPLFGEPGKATSIEDLGRRLASDFDGNSTVIRKDLDRLIAHFIQVEELIDEGASLSNNINILLENTENFAAALATDNPSEVTVSGEGGRKTRFGRVETAFNEVKRKTKELFDGRFFNGKEFGHQDITPSGLRLTGLAIALQGLEDNILEEKGKKNTLIREGNIKVTPKAIVLEKQTISALRKVKKQIQTMVIASRLVEKMQIKTGLKNSKEKYQYLAEEFNKISNLQDELTAEKEKFFDTMTGKAQLKLKVESKTYNRWKAFYQAAFGRNASSILNKHYPEKTFNQFFLKKVSVPDLEGSTSIKRKIKKDIADIAVGKTPKKERTRKASTGRPKKMPKRKNSISAKTRAMAQTAAAVKRKANKQTKKAETKRESATGQEDLFKLERLINRRLPAEVRRNMGRPALQNQTGRFSNSVKLESLRQTAGGISGEYSYQLSPYETFENTGSRRWPTGYNPKPLIAKSIRNLAIQYTEQKFTSLRRT